MKKFSVLSLVVSGAMIFSFTGFGCKKAEQPVEAPKPAAQAPADGSGMVVKEFTFEDGAQKWFPSKNCKVAQDTNVKHEGSASLKVIGKSNAGLWNYAESPKFDIASSKHYKLTGWMFVESFNSPDPKPLFQLKVGIYKDGKWIKNQLTKNYAITKKGEWQMLSVEFDTPSESNLTGNFTVDKRPMDKNVEATIYVDDVSLQQMN